MGTHNDKNLNKKTIWATVAISVHVASEETWRTLCCTYLCILYIHTEVIFDRRDQMEKALVFFWDRKSEYQREINISMGERFCQLMCQEKLITAWWGSVYSPGRRGEYVTVSSGSLSTQDVSISRRPVVYSWTKRMGSLYSRDRRDEYQCGMGYLKGQDI